MNHKRRRPKRQRAGCNCGHKNAKREGGLMRGMTSAYGSSGAWLRLRERARDHEGGGGEGMR